MVRMMNDIVLMEMLDRLVIENANAIEEITERLYDNHWKGNIGTKEMYVMAVTELVKVYTYHRNQMEIIDAANMAVAKVLANPNIQKLVSEMMANGMNAKLGVE